MITLTSDVLEKMEEEIETSELMNGIGLSDELCDYSSQIQDDLSLLNNFFLRFFMKAKHPRKKTAIKFSN